MKCGILCYTKVIWLDVCFGDRQPEFGSILYYLRLCDPGPATFRFFTIKCHNDNYFPGTW